MTAPVSERSPRTPRISASNPLGVLNWGTPPATAKRLIRPRTRHDTPGTEKESRPAMNGPSEALKELLPVLAKGWAPEETSGLNDLCGAHALSQGILNTLRLRHEHATLLPWAQFEQLSMEMASASFKEWVRTNLRLLWSPTFERPASNLTPSTLQFFQGLREEDISERLDVEMSNAEIFSESFFSIDQMASFVLYLEKQHNNSQRSYRLGVVSPDRNETGKYAVYLSGNEAHLPVIWLYNTGHGHWQSIGPAPDRVGLRGRKRWGLESNIKTVVDNGLYRVERDVDGVDREYLLGCRTGQWVYQVERPSQLSERPGYIYVHTTQGPNQDPWIVPETHSAVSIRGEEGFISVEALKEMVTYTVLEGNRLKDKQRQRPRNKTNINITKSGQTKKPTAEGSTPKTTGTTKQETPTTTGTTKQPTTKQPTTNQSTTKQPPVRRQINISENLPSAPKIAPPPPGINRQRIIPIPIVSARLPGSTPNGRIFRMFRARLPNRDPWTRQRFKDGHLVYNHGQVLLALDHIDDENPPALLRVRSQDENEGLAELKNLDEIEKPFYLDDSSVYQPKSNDQDVVFPEADFPLAKLQGQCRLRNINSTGTRQELARRLMDEQQRRGVGLAVFRMQRNVGSLASGSLVRLQTNRMPQGANQVAACGLQGRSFGRVLAADLLQESHAWGIRLVVRQGATPPNRGTANVPMTPQKMRRPPPRNAGADEVAALLSNLATATPEAIKESESAERRRIRKALQTPHPTYTPLAGTGTGTRTKDESDNADDSDQWDWDELSRPMTESTERPATPMPPAEVQRRTRMGLRTRTAGTSQSDASRAMPPPLPLQAQLLKGRATVTPTGSPIAKGAVEKGKRAREEGGEEEEGGGQARKKKKEKEKKKPLLPPRALKRRTRSGRSGASGGSDAGADPGGDVGMGGV